MSVYKHLSPKEAKRPHFHEQRDIKKNGTAWQWKGGDELMKFWDAMNLNTKE